MCYKKTILLPSGHFLQRFNMDSTFYMGLWLIQKGWVFLLILLWSLYRKLCSHLKTAQLFILILCEWWAHPKILNSAVNWSKRTLSRFAAMSKGIENIRGVHSTISIAHLHFFCARCRRHGDWRVRTVLIFCGVILILP